MGYPTTLSSLSFSLAAPLPPSSFITSSSSVDKRRRKISVTQRPMALQQLLVAKKEPTPIPPQVTTTTPLFNTNSKSNTDLPSKLSEIFAHGGFRNKTHQNLTAMKSLTKSCADLRRVNSEEGAGSGELLLAAQPPPHHHLHYSDVDHHYKTIHTNIPSRHKQFEPRKPSPLLFRTHLSGSMSDSEDEPHPLKSPPQRISPPKMMIKGKLRDDPAQMLQAKLKQTHSLMNLPAIKASLNLRLSDEPSSPSSVYHTVHGISSTTPLYPQLPTQPRRGRFGASESEVEEEEEEEEYEDYYGGRRVYSPTSSGYKTMCSAYNDPGLIRFLREKERCFMVRSSRPKKKLHC
jgi:hypothetical protein